MMSEPIDASSPFPWPPVIFASAFALALAASWQLPLRLVSDDQGAVHTLGILIIIGGGFIALAAEWSFLRVGTATLPTRPTWVVVPDGVFRFTRNPMYLGLCIVLAGAGFFANSWWFLIVLPFAVIAMTKLAIEHEEAYLGRKFGSVYLAYKARTRRWL